MSKKTKGYRPQPETAAMLDRAWQIVTETPYAVTARFIFYRLLGEGWYTPKNSKEKQRDYKDRFLKALSKARHENYKEWRPDTIVDDTRQPLVRGSGFPDVRQWLTAVQQQLVCTLDLWETQPYYIELWTEHHGQVSQFRYYTDGITIRPMGGQASIEYKYQSAVALTQAARRYDRKPIVLYFGDLDKGGKDIEATLRRDVSKWADTPFDMIWCGITADHVSRYGLPDNPEKPGQYQWEALSDQAAGEVIREAVSQYVRQDAMKRVRQKEDQATEWLRQRLADVVTEWVQ